MLGEARRLAAKRAGVASNSSHGRCPSPAAGLPKGSPSSTRTISRPVRCDPPRASAPDAVVAAPSEAARAVGSLPTRRHPGSALPSLTSSFRGRSPTGRDRRSGPILKGVLLGALSQLNPRIPGAAASPAIPRSRAQRVDATIGFRSKLRRQVQMDVAECVVERDLVEPLPPGLDVDLDYFNRLDDLAVQHRVAVIAVRAPAERRTNEHPKTGPASRPLPSWRIEPYP